VLSDCCQSWGWFPHFLAYLGRSSLAKPRQRGAKDGSQLQEVF
jgi:hypothetical protein